MFKRNHFQSFAGALFLAFATVAAAQTPQPPTLPGTISTVNTGSYTLAVPSGVAVDQNKNLYISDTDMNRIIKVDAGGAASVYAGAANGTPGNTGDGGAAASALLNGPEGLAVAANGDLYIAEFGNKDVRKVSASTGTITTIATGLTNPTGLAYDDAGQNLYIADYGGKIIKVDQGGNASQVFSSIAIVKPSTAAFANGYLYVVDNAATALYKINASTGAYTTLNISGLANIWGVALDPAGDVYISEYGNASQSKGGQVVMVDTSGTQTVIAGSGGFGYGGDGGAAPDATFEDSVTGVAIGPDGSLYIDQGKTGTSVSVPINGNPTTLPVGVVRKVTFPAPSTPPPSGPPVNNIPGCTVINFSAGPNPIYTDGPYGLTTIQANVTCPYEIHIGSPNGQLFATGNGFSATLTGNWVTDGMQFYLQQSGNTTSTGTLALPITVHLKPGFPGLACLATAFSASPNPIITGDEFGQTTITAITNCSFDIRIDSPSGPEFNEGRGYAAFQTGKWVKNGMTLYLQPHADTSASDTLSVLKLVMQPPPAGCTVNSFTADPNPIPTTSVKGKTTIKADATCQYDVRVGSPDGGSIQSKDNSTGLMGTGSGQTSFATDDWVINGMTFYLQKHGSVDASGTLATLTANLVLPDQGEPSCKISQFSATDNPIIAAGGTGQTTVNVNASCAWDLRLNDAAGKVLTSGTGAGSATATNVTNGTKFYLQPKDDTYFGDNLAVLNATVAPQTPSGCTVLVFSASPVESDGAFGYSTISADATCPYDIRVDSPNGTLFGSGNGFTSANTDNWVTFGQKFYLQKQGDTTAAGTLAVESAIVLPNITR